MLSFWGLLFPLLLLLVIIFAIAWLLLAKPRYAMISGIALILGIKGISVFFAFHTSSKFNYQKSPSTIRVVSWNVAQFIELKKNNNKGGKARGKIFDLIREQDADVLCLQEFFTSGDPAWYENISYIVDSLHYPYWYFSDQYNGDLHYLGSIIFSRHPIIDSGRVQFPPPTLPEALIYTDIVVNLDTVRVFTTHLQSIRFFKREYEQIKKIKQADDSLLYNSMSILSKIRKSAAYRSIQADIVRDEIKKSPYPVVLCGDMNDVPNSYTYFTVKGKMQDAFLKRGSGIGRTYSDISPTLRIDYIFTDKHFKIVQFNRLVKKLSDHYMLVADLQLK
ncbi:MAG: endonuclease/exonuclease/phosphatase family protein [Bacteroidota bacterium]|nr:endonuclease/exonuclease/phosphatase family protein [Bacteroidota bacterium]